MDSQLHFGFWQFRSRALGTAKFQDCVLRLRWSDLGFGGGQLLGASSPFSHGESRRGRTYLSGDIARNKSPKLRCVSMQPLFRTAQRNCPAGALTFPMADVFTKAKRSEIMSRIRPSGNSSTELRLARLLRTARVTGWRRHQRVPGNPDFLFRKQRLAVFVDGCFWHKCPKCYREPKTQTAFWVEKIVRNQERDRRSNLLLKKAGWTVIRIWECELKKNANRCVKRIIDRIHPKSKHPTESRNTDLATKLLNPKPVSIFPLQGDSEPPQDWVLPSEGSC